MTRADVATIFSYTGTAKSLRSRDVSIAEKLALCENLISNSKTLTPHPAPLVQQHVFYILQTEDEQAHPMYWRLLVKLLQSTEKATYDVQLPSVLFAIAAKHLTGGPHLQQAVLAALQYIHSRDVPLLTPTLAQNTALTAVVMEILQTDATVEPLAINLLTTQLELQKHTREEKMLQSLATSQLFIPLISAPKRLAHLCDRVLSSSLFISPSNSQTALLKFFGTSTSPQLAQAAGYALRSYVHLVRSLASSATYVKKRGWGELPMDVCQILVFFRDICNALHQSTLSACETLTSSGKSEENGADETAARVRVRTEALTALFEVGHELSIYRPSYDARLQTASRHSKKSKVAGDKTVVKEQKQKSINLGKSIAAWFTDLVKILADLYARKNLHMDAIQWLTDPIKAILTFSLDTVSDDVGKLLASIVTKRESSRRNYVRIPSRVSLLVTLIRSYHGTRTLPILFKTLTSTVHGFPLLGIMTEVFQDKTVQRELAEAVGSLPRGQPAQCIRELMSSDAKDTFSSEDAPIVSFLVALILETVNTSETSSVLSAAREVVFPVFANHGSSLEARCGSLYLLASVFFAAIRTGMQFSSEELQNIINSGLVSSARGSPFHYGDESKAGVLETLLDLFSRDAPPSDPNVCFNLIRFISVLLHAFAASKSGDRVKPSMQRAFILLFQCYEEFSGSDKAQISKWRFFYDDSALGAVTPIIGSLSRMLDYSLSDCEPPVGLVTFLGQYAENYDVDDSRWEELLETSIVRRALPAALVARITNCSASEEKANESDGCHSGPKALFRLIQGLPDRYLVDKDERDIAKCIEKKYGVLSSGDCQEEAFQAVLSMKYASLSFWKYMMPQALQHMKCDWILRRLVQFERNASSGESAIGLIDSVFKIAKDESASFAAVGFLARNVYSVIQHTTEGCPSDVSIEADIVSRYSRIVSALLNQTLKELTKGRNSSERCMCLRLLSSTLSLRVSLAELIAALSQHSEKLTLAVAELDKFLRRMTRPGLAAASNIVSESLQDDELTDAGRELLLLFCGHPSIYSSFTGNAVSKLITSNLCALSLQFLCSGKADVRTSGIQLLAAIISSGSDDEICEISGTVTAEMRRTLNERCSVGETLDLDQATTCVRYGERMRGGVLAGATILCGGGIILKEGVFEGFIPVRKRQDLIMTVRLEKEATGELVCTLLELCCRMIESSQSMNNVRARDRDAVQSQISCARDMSWKSALMCVQTAEMAIVRGAAFEMSGVMTQQVMVELGNILVKAQAEEADVGEETLTAIASVCRAICHKRGIYGLPHAVCGLVRSLLRHPGAQTGRRGMEMSMIYGQLVAAGDEVVQGALIDACEGLADGGEGLNAAGELAEGITKLVGACGEGGVRTVMHILSDDGKSVLRAVRELYMSERYRGK